MTDAGRDDRLCPEHLREAVETVAKSNGFKNIRWKFQSATKPGENYGSVLHRVEITEDGDEDVARRLSVIVKSAIQNEEVRRLCRLERAFSNEANFYSLVLTVYADQLREAGLLTEGAHYPDAPRCFLSCAGRGARDVLVLQDLRPEGYKLLPRRPGLDAEHCRAALGALARLHAHSLALERRRPDQFRSLRGTVAPVVAEILVAMKVFDEEVMLKNVSEMIGKRFPEGTLHHQKAVEICGTASNDILDITSPSDDDCNVICHGDCWTNNLLFKYSAAGDVEHVRLLDFQGASYASPVLDVANLLFVCTERAMRERHLDELLRGYHAELQGSLRALGLADPDAVFSWARFQDHLRRHGRFGLYLAVAYLPMMLAADDEVPDFDARVSGSGGTDAGELLAVHTKDTTERDTRVSDVLEDMVRLGCI